MQVELSIRDIEIIEDAFAAIHDQFSAFSEEEDLIERLAQAKEQAEELESIDLNDCAGGACKL